jgi:hypothetical protein
MAEDIRFDVIKDIDPNYLQEMNELRDEFMALDFKLQTIGSTMSANASARAISHARTNLEISLMFAIKSLCILGEMK